MRETQAALQEATISGGERQATVTEGQPQAVGTTRGSPSALEAGFATQGHPI